MQYVKIGHLLNSRVGGVRGLLASRTSYNKSINMQKQMPSVSAQLEKKNRSLTATVLACGCTSLGKHPAH